MGNKISKKNRSGPPPSTRTASHNSSGTVIKNWRNRKVAVADAMSGKINPEYVSSIFKSATTLYVDRIRTSTGNIKVIKIIQKKNIRKRKRKYTMAKADRREIDIFPKAIPKAMMALFIIILATVATTSPLPVVSAWR